ncbi:MULTISPECIES: VOC family protein [unclassified Rathayibacter]|uniref:VOC family protein n=1 Tax=unclassified Rathayibacter TaxID=2609250 RepID=UPI0006F3C25E|nr:MULTISPECIES: VOC family protein [unclassified Rathayibacter]KQQ05776.1 bleomycin resistance protein [Rathayibacter sp. Leaf294]KQS13634.1 bleomycin resistance protein [Rathayibacter sp. Leaf185]
MTFSVTPHLNFDGDARAALAFYGAALGIEPTLVTYGQMGASDDPAWADRIVYGDVVTPDGFAIKAFDVWPHQPYDQGSNAFYAYVESTDREALTRLWHGLLDGAEIRQPLGPSAWSPLAGQLLDRFGVVWALEAPEAR